MTSRRQWYFQQRRGNKKKIEKKKMNNFITFCILTFILEVYSSNLPRELSKKESYIRQDLSKCESYVKSNFIQFSMELSETRRVYLQRVIAVTDTNLRDLDEFQNKLGIKMVTVKKNKVASKDCQAVVEKLEKQLQQLNDKTIDCATSEFAESESNNREIYNVYTKSLVRIQEQKDKLKTCGQLYNKSPEGEAATLNCFSEISDVIARVKANAAMQFSSKAVKMQRLNDEDLDFDDCTANVRLDETLDQEEHLSALLDKCSG